MMDHFYVIFSVEYRFFLKKYAIFAAALIALGV